MGMSLVTDAEKAEWSAVFDDIHSTWGRDVYIFLEPQRVIITEDANYNYGYGDSQPAINVTYTPVSGVFKGRIKWMDIDTKYIVDYFDELKPNTLNNFARIKLDPSGYHFLGTGQREIWVDDKKCDWNGTAQPHGLFGVQYYDIYVRESR